MKKKNPYWKKGKFLEKKFIDDINKNNPNIKIFLTAKRKDGKIIEIPVPKYVLFELADFQYYDGDNFEKVRDRMRDFFIDCDFLEQDVVNEGIVLTYDPKTKDWTKKIKGQYIYKKPKWKNPNYKKQKKK